MASALELGGFLLVEGKYTFGGILYKELKLDIVDLKSIFADSEEPNQQADAAAERL